MMNCEDFRKYVDMVPEGLRCEPDLQAVNQHAAECETCLKHLALDREFENLLDDMPVVQPPTAFVSNVMDRIRVSADDTSTAAAETRQAAFPLLLLGTTAVGLMLIVTGFVLGLAENGLNVALQRLVVNIGPVMGGALYAMPESSPAIVSQVVGMAILLFGLLFSGSAKLPLKTSK